MCETLYAYHYYSLYYRTRSRPFDATLYTIVTILFNIEQSANLFAIHAEGSCKLRNAGF